MFRNNCRCLTSSVLLARSAGVYTRFAVKLQGSPIAQTGQKFSNPDEGKVLDNLRVPKYTIYSIGTVVLLSYSTFLLDRRPHRAGAVHWENGTCSPLKNPQVKNK